MKTLLIRIFLKDKFIGAIASAISATASAYLVSLLPGVPEVAHIALRALFDLPAGEITPAGLTAILTPIFYSVLSTFVQEYLLRENNKSLKVLESTGEYTGAIDGLVGEVARTAINALSENRKN